MVDVGVIVVEDVVMAVVGVQVVIMMLFDVGFVVDVMVIVLLVMVFDVVWM